MNDPSLFTKLPEEQQKVLLRWISENLTIRKTTNKDVGTSYGIKHIFERSEDGFYISNGQFKGAMIMAGFQPHDASEINPYYNISSLSPCFSE